MNKLLTLSTPVPAAIEPRIVKQTFSHGRTRTVIVEKIGERERTQIEVPVVPKPPAIATIDKPHPSPPSEKKLEKSKKSRLQRELEAREEAKRKRTRKIIKKLRAQKRRQGTKTLPTAKDRPRKKSDRFRAREEALKDRVAELARLIRQYEAPELYDRDKAKSEVDWIYGIRTSGWSSNDRVRLEFVLEVLNSVVAGRRPTYIKTPDGGYFPWPSTEVGDSTHRQPIAEPPHEIGVLKEMGYRVGASGVDASERRSILSEVYRDELRLNLSAEYLAEWGEPETAQRLRKLANTIASLARNMKGRRLTETASIREWESDLEFLRQAFYVGRYDFKWPTP